MHIKNKSKFLSIYLLVLILILTTCKKKSWPPKVQSVSKDSPALSPEEALQTFFLPPGYEIELVASEPLVVDPVAMDFDADGRLWVVEMRSYMPNADAEGEKEPVGKVVVLEDTTGDGQMDKRTVYMENLVLPRTVKVLDHGVLVGAPPNLWMTQDTTGNLKADVVQKVREDFGDPTVNPESNPNSLMWGMDNWIHTTRYEGRFRLTNNRLDYDKTLSLGQWGISMDNYGRIYRNSNSNPLAVDYISSHYYMRNQHVRQQRGIYESIYKNRAVWPVRPTTGINRGYRENMLRDDSTLARYTSASALSVYRGDRLPEELHSNVFVPEPAGNLIQRLIIEKQEDGSLIGYNPYEDLEADFLTSTDERFRPVNIYSSPDGTLYIVDMYRGIIQHQQFLTNYLETEIEKRGLEKPLGLGRIYRVVHKSSDPGPKPQLSSKSPQELVTYLSHPNGWWRDTAQRLLVERQSTSVVPELRELVRNADKDYIRLHALWTLDGLKEEIDYKIFETALSDPSPHLRAAAIRIAEPIFTRSEDIYKKEIMNLIDDSTSIVQRQLAASIGEFPTEERKEAFMELLERHGDDPMIVTLVISALPDQEFAFLAQLLEQASEHQGTTNTVEELAKVVFKSDSGVHVNTLLNWISDSDKPNWQRESLLAALEEVAPEPSSGRVRLLELDQKPTGLLAAADSDSEDRQMADRISDVVNRLGWPGKPRTEPEPEPLTPEEKKRFEHGKKLFTTSCASCHQQKGQGIKGMGAPLVDSKWVLGQASHLIRILLDGKDGDMRMPPAGHHSDEELAAIATYIRQAWGHEERPVTPSEVKEVRGASTGRDQPWTEEELNNHRH